jgi:hypothetical protein
MQLYATKITSRNKLLQVRPPKNAAQGRPISIRQAHRPNHLSATSFLSGDTTRITWREHQNAYILAYRLLLAVHYKTVQFFPAPIPIVEERATCNQDNLLNALESPSNLLSSCQFCSPYLSIPPVSTVTVYTVSLYLFSTSLIP